MDPTYLDPQLFSTIGGIVTLTIAIVEAMKRVLAHHRTLNAVPTAVYALAVATALTVGAHHVELLHGDVRSLIGQALVNTLTAFGVLAVKANGTMPIGHSEAARRRRSQ